MATSPDSRGPTLFDLTSYAADTPANRSAKPENDGAKMTHVTSGPTFERPLATYDPATRSWKMYGATYLWGECPSLETLPTSGIAQSGALYPRPPWAPLIRENESLSWPTPTAVMRPMEGNVRMYRALIEAGYMTEVEALAILGKSPWESQGKIPERWPTPTVSDAWTHGLKSSQQTEGSRHSLNLPSAVGGKLNPTWVEWLMGFPPGWTDLEDSATP